MFKFSNFSTQRKIKFSNAHNSWLVNITYITRLYNNMCIVYTSFRTSCAEIILKILDHFSDSLTTKIPSAVWNFAFSKFPHAFVSTIDSSERRKGQESFGVVNRDLHNDQRGLMFQGDRADTMKCFAHGNSKFTGSGRNFIVGLPCDRSAVD